jgi:hypothetical protein
MKHLIPINEYFSNINEGLNFNNGSDADLEEVGGCFANGGDPENHGEEALIEMGREALKDAKPFPLTGKIKEDAPKLIKYITDAFKKAGVELEDKNADLIKSTSLGTVNVIEIPVANQSTLYFSTSLDYYEMANTGHDMYTGGSFADEDGPLDFFVADISNNGQIVKAAAEFKKFLENTQK